MCYPAFVPSVKTTGINEAGVLGEIPMLDKLAAEEKIDVIDIHGALKDPPKLLPDGVHPNRAGATVMAKAVFKTLTGREFYACSANK